MASTHNKRASKFSQIKKSVERTIDRANKREADNDLHINKAISMHAIERYYERVLNMPFDKRHIKKVENVLLQEIPKSLLDLKMSAKLPYLDEYTIIVHRGIVVTIIKGE